MSENPFNKIAETIDKMTISMNFSQRIEVSTRERYNGIINSFNQLLDNVEYRFNLQKLVSLISTSFINTSYSEFNELIPNLIKIIGETINCDNCYLYTLNSTATNLNVFYLWSRIKTENTVNDLKLFSIKISPWLIEQLIYNDEYLLLNSVDEVNEESINEKEILHARKFEKFLAVPLIYHDDLEGFFIIENNYTSKNWDKEEIEILCTISELLVNAIKDKESEEEILQLNLSLEKKVLIRTEQLNITNKKLKKTLKHLEEDEEAGKKIQFKLLPDNKKEISNIEFSYCLYPSLYLSGDFLDYFQIDENHIAFYFADVSGHGVSSAFVTVMLKTFINNYLEKLRTFKDNILLRPEKLLKALNKAFIDENLGKYLTFFYAVIDTQEDIMEFSNGGQYPFPVFISDIDRKFLAMKSTPVGLFEFSDYISDKIELPENFLLFICSDGVLDILQIDSVEKKEEFLLTFIDGCEQDIKCLTEKIKIHEIEFLPDDITMLLIKRRLHD